MITQTETSSPAEQIIPPFEAEDVFEEYEPREGDLMNPEIRDEVTFLLAQYLDSQSDKLMALRTLHAVVEKFIAEAKFTSKKSSKTVH